MADISNFYSDGSTKWSAKKSFQANNIPVPIPSISNVISGLKAVDVQTDVQKISVKIVKDFNIVCHIPLSGYTSTDINGNQLTINTSDELPIILEFINSTEALAADARFTICVNGGIV